MDKPNLVIYHASCADGFGAAWAAWQQLGDTANYVAASYGQQPPDCTGKNVYIVDFSYPPEEMLTIAERADSVVVLDHHKKAIETLTPHAEALRDAGCTLRFSDTLSGAVMAWDYFHGQAATPILLMHIQDRDLWQFKLADTREVAAALHSYPMDFMVWTELSKNVGALMAEGAAIVRTDAKRTLEAAKYARPMVIGGVTVPTCNAPTFMASDLGHELCKGLTTFAAVYTDGPDGRKFSLRSDGPTGADVDLIARQYGGGGHRNAAGFRVPLNWEGDYPVPPTMPVSFVEESSGMVVRTDKWYLRSDSGSTYSKISFDTAVKAWEYTQTPQFQTTYGAVNVSTPVYADGGFDNVEACNVMFGADLWRCQEYDKANHVKLMNQ